MRRSSLEWCADGLAIDLEGLVLLSLNTVSTSKHVGYPLARRLSHLSWYRVQSDDLDLHNGRGGRV